MKKTGRKLVTALVATILAIGLTACGGGGTKPDSNAPAAGVQKSDAQAQIPGGMSDGKGRIAYIIGHLGDKSFNDSGAEGMKTLRAEGWDCKILEAGDETKTDKWEDMILDTIEEGYEYIVASATYRDILIRLCKEYPEVRFICFDDAMDEAEIPENMAFIFYAQNEGSYMVGQLAAGMSESKVVAVNVGMDNPVIADFVTGFINGVQDYDPECKVVKATVGSWNDPAKMKELCLSQARDKKADVFYQVAGGGLFEACKELNTWAIGVDSDQHQYYKNSENPELADVIVTSMLKNVGDSFVSIFHDMEAGKDIWQKVNRLGLIQNSVGYVDNDFFRENAPEEVRQNMADAQAKIISGEKKVKSYYDFMDEAEYQAMLDSAAP